MFVYITYSTIFTLIMNETQFIMTRLFETTTYIEDGETTLGIRSN